MEPMIAAVVVLGAFNLLLFVVAIRYAINESKATARLSELVHEVRMLRRDVAQLDAARKRPHIDEHI